MSDCANVQVRELLPEYLHGRLDAIRRVHVEAHLATCEECTAELSLLRSVVSAYASAPSVSVSAIVRALPQPGRRRQRSSFSSFSAWRIAALISFISLGGISLAIVRPWLSGDAGGLGQDSAITLAADSDTGVGGAVVTPVSGGARRGISFAGGVSDLQSEDLQALLKEIESMEAAPPAEPEDPTQGVSDRRRSGASQE